MNFRNNYSRLAGSLFQKGESEKAVAVLDKCMNQFPAEVVMLNYFSLPIIDLYFKLGEIKKGNKVLANMIDNQLTKIKYLKEFDSGSGVKQELQITAQILGNLNRILKNYRLEDPAFNYTEEDGIYYKEKDGNKEVIDFNTYRINTFMDEYSSIL